MRSTLERNIAAAFSTSFHHRQHIDEFDLTADEVNYAQSLELPLDYVTPLVLRSGNIMWGKLIYARNVSANGFLSACTGFMLSSLFYSKGVVVQDPKYMVLIDCLPSYDYYYEDLGAKIHARKIDPSNLILVRYYGTKVEVAVENIGSETFSTVPAFDLDKWHSTYHEHFGISYKFVDILEDKSKYTDKTTADINDALIRRIEQLLPRRVKSEATIERYESGVELRGNDVYINDLRVDGRHADCSYSALDDLMKEYKDYTKDNWFFTAKTLAKDFLDDVASTYAEVIFRPFRNYLEATVLKDDDNNLIEPSTGLQFV